MIARVRVSFTIVAYSSTCVPVPFILSHTAAVAVTEEVSLTAVPANNPKPMLESPMASPNWGNTKAATTLKKNTTEIACAISWSSALITGAAAAIAEPPQMDEPTPMRTAELESIWVNR